MEEENESTLDFTKVVCTGCDKDLDLTTDEHCENCFTCEKCCTCGLVN